MIAPIYTPTNTVQEFSFPTSSPTFVNCGLFNDSHSDRGEVIFFVDFSCISLVISDAEHLFMCMLPILLWENVYSDLLPIFQVVCFMMLSHVSCLYILDSNPISVILFSPISVGHLFVLPMVSFAVQNLFS